MTAQHLALVPQGAVRSEHVEVSPLTKQEPAIVWPDIDSPLQWAGRFLLISLMLSLLLFSGLAWASFSQ